jgi:RHS repeat-associated protein
VATVDSTAAVYTYDGEGHRVKKVVSSGENTRFIYGLGGLVAEYDGSSGNLKKEYLSGGITVEPTAVNSNGTQYPTGDRLGSPRVLTNSSGSVASRHDYLPFGEDLGAGTGGRTTAMGFSNSGDTNRKKFTGYERDTESGLDFGQARFYASANGRFTSPDPFSGSAIVTDPQTYNRYTYCRNNPVNSTDPTGMAPDMGARFSMATGDGMRNAGSSKNHGSWQDIVGDVPPQAAVEATEAANSGAQLDQTTAPAQGLTLLHEAAHAASASQSAAGGPATIDNSDLPDQGCRIEIDFTGKDGKGLQGLPMGPGMIDTANAGRVFGVGLDVTVSGLEGGVGTYGSTDSGGPDPLRRPNGVWTVEQQVGNYTTRNDQVTDGGRPHPDPLQISRNREFGETSVKYHDNPGYRVSAAGNDKIDTLKTFRVSASNGTKQCQIQFQVHVTFNGTWTGTWNKKR